tara:strand:+ start:2589 stop:3308 length:720 start_codon:yes stop_codon:yes gene_type:complete
MVRAVFNNGQQIFKEYCDRCGELVRTLHISDITTRHDHDLRTITIIDADDANLTLKPPSEKLAEITASFISRNLLTSHEAFQARSTKKLAHGWRPQMMCTESIDIIGGVTQSYCGNTSLPIFKTAVLNSTTIGNDFADALPYQDYSGSKVGVDRFGVIVRLKSKKELPEANSAVIYKGPFLTNWWLTFATVAERAQYTLDARGCTTLINTYGQAAVDDMTVVSNFANKRAWISYMASNC